jgi:probable phosphoglycerate mutase
VSLAPGESVAAGLDADGVTAGTGGTSPAPGESVAAPVVPGAEDLTRTSTAVLVRHALPLTGVSGDPGLAPDGREQAAKVAAWLRWEAPVAVVSSPYRRAVETAEPIAVACGVELEVDESLREWSAPRPAQYITPELLGRTDRGRAFAEGRFADFVPEHDREELRLRMTGAVRRATARWPGRTVVLVSHGGAINNLMANVLSLPETFFFNPGYTSLCRLHVMSSGRLVPVSVNETAHLVSVRTAA